MTDKKKTYNDLNEFGKKKAREINAIIKNCPPVVKGKKKTPQFSPGLLQKVNASTDHWEFEIIEQNDGNTIKRPCLLDSKKEYAITLEGGSKGFDVNNKDILNGYVSRITSLLINSPAWGEFVSYRRQLNKIERALEKAKSDIDKKKKNELASNSASNAIVIQDLESNKKALEESYKRVSYEILGTISALNDDILYKVSNHLEWSSNRKPQGNRNAIYAQMSDVKKFDEAVQNLLKSRFQKTQKLERTKETKTGKRNEKVRVIEAPEYMFKPFTAEYTCQDFDKLGNLIEEKRQFVNAIKMNTDALINFVLQGIEVIEYPLAIREQTPAQRTATIYCLQIFKNNVFKPSRFDFYPSVAKILGILLTPEQRQKMIAAEHRGRIFDAFNNWLNSCINLGIFSDVEIKQNNKAKDLFPELANIAARRTSIQTIEQLSTAKIHFTPCEAPFNESYYNNKLKRLQKEQQTLFDNPLFWEFTEKNGGK